MKLHLPHGLRKALLAFMASFALAMPTTFATASGTDAAFAEFQLLSVPQAAAVDIGYGEDAPDARDETEWFGEIEKEFEVINTFSFASDEVDGTSRFGEIAGDKPVVIAADHTWNATASTRSFTWDAGIGASDAPWASGTGATNDDFSVVGWGGGVNSVPRTRW